MRSFLTLFFLVVGILMCSQAWRSYQRVGLDRWMVFAVVFGLMMFAPAMHVVYVSLIQNNMPVNRMNEHQLRKHIDKLIRKTKCE